MHHTRTRLEHMDAAVKAWSDAFGGEGAFDAMVLEGDPLTVTLGAVPHMPEDQHGIQMAPWELWFLLRAVRDKLERRLLAEESEAKV